MRTLSVDAAFRKSGYALFDDQELVKYGVLRSNGDMKTLQQKVAHLIGTITRQKAINCLVIEDQYLGANFSSCKKSIEARALWEAIARQYDIPIEKIYPATWQGAVLHMSSRAGRKLLKHYSIVTTKLLFKIQVEDDIADAILLGYYFQNKNRIREKANG